MSESYEEAIRAAVNDPDVMAWRLSMARTSLPLPACLRRLEADHGVPLPRIASDIERERCAQIAEDWRSTLTRGEPIQNAADYLANRIRTGCNKTA